MSGLTYAADELSREAWRTPDAVLSHLLETYSMVRSADIGVTTQHVARPGAETLVGRRFTSSFALSAGLRTHLRDLADDPGDLGEAVAELAAQTSRESGENHDGVDARPKARS